MIVDDNAEFRDVARGALHSAGLAVVAVASDIAGALAVVEEHQPDIVLVDIHLGAESGFELAHQLHQRFKGSHAVVLTSVHSEYEFAEVIAASPVAGFIPKANLSAAAILELAGPAAKSVAESASRKECDHR